MTTRLLPAAALLVALSSFAHAVDEPGAFTVEIINDSGIDNLFFLLTSGKEDIDVSKPASATSGELPAMGWPGSGDATPQLLSALPTDGSTWTSPYTGNSPEIYSFDVASLNSGKFLFMEGKNGETPFTYTDDAPSPSFLNAAFRYDLAELTILPDAPGGADTTSIDQVGIQIQMELFESDKPDEILESRYYYLSTFSLIEEIEKMSGVKGSNAMLGLNTSGDLVEGWTTDGDPSMSDFVRALGPPQISSVVPALSPAPFTDFKYYLESLVGTSVHVQGSGQKVGDEPVSSTYDYTGVFKSLGDKGFEVELTGTTGNIPTGNPDYPANAPVTIHLPIPQQATFEATLKPVGIYELIQTKHAGAGFPNNTGADKTMMATVSEPEQGSDTAVVEVTVDTSGNLKAYADTGSLFKVISAGAGYTAPPSVTVTGGTTDAEGIAFLNGSSIESVTVIDGGNGYYENKPITITGGSLPAVGSGDAPTYMNAVGTAVAENGEITEVIFTGPNDTKGEGFGTYDPAVFVQSYEGNNEPQGSYNHNIYGAPLNLLVYQVGDLTQTQSKNLTTESVYGAMTRDVLAGLNLGYPGGVYGDSGLDWYSAAPTSYPFGLARKTNDGYYNPWAATIFNHSDAYSYAFSDRGGGPSPLIDLPSGESMPESGLTLRIVLLPDMRLDSPSIETATAKMQNGKSVIDLTWNEIDNATGYEIVFEYPEGIDPIQLTGKSNTSYTLGASVVDLPPGMPITYGVRAVASGPPKLESPVQYQSIITAGELVPSTAGTETLTNTLWAPETISPNIDQSTIKFYLNGQEFDYSSGSPTPTNVPYVFNAQGEPTPVTNQFAFVVKGNVQNPDTEQYEERTLFANIFRAQFNLTATNEFVTPVNELINSSQPANIAYNESAQPGLPAGTYGTTGLVINLNFAPIPVKATTDVVTPPLQSYEQWTAQFPGMNTAFTANDDGDMHPNLMEYFFGTDPLVDQDNRYPELIVSDEYLRLSFPISKSYQGIEGELFWSSNLTHWYSANVESYEEVEVNGQTIRTAVIPNPGIDSGEGIFFQIVVFED